MRTTALKTEVYKIILLTALFLTFTTALVAGTGSSGTTKELYREVVDKAAQLAEGSEALKTNINYPRAAMLAGFQGRVIAKVYVDENGKVDDVEFIKKMGGGFETSILKALMETKFTPASLSNKPVKSVAVLSFRFELD